MSKACYDCPFNVSDCMRPHCVATDGHERPIVTANRRMPGPSIQVRESFKVSPAIDQKIAGAPEQTIPREWSFFGGGDCNERNLSCYELMTFYSTM